MTSIRHRRFTPVVLGSLMVAGSVVGALARPALAKPPSGDSSRAVHLVQAAETPKRGPVISRIEINGLVVIDEAVVRSALSIRLGQPFDAERLRADADAIYRLGWFHFTPGGGEGGSRITRRDDAEGNVEVHIFLVENPIVREIRLTGASRQPTAQQVAQKVAWVQVGRPLNTNRDRQNQALKDLEALYREALAMDVTASLPGEQETPPGVERLPDGTVAVNVRIATKGGESGKPTAPPTKPPAAGGLKPPAGGPTTPGGATPKPGTDTPGRERDDSSWPDESRLRVTAVQIRGLRNVPEREVKGVIKTTVNSYYDRAVLTEDLRRLRELGYFYFAEDRADLMGIGYPVLPERVGSRAFPQADADRRGVVVVFELIENPRIKAVRFMGNTLLTAPALSKELARLAAGAVFRTNADLLERERERLEGVYRNHGYAAQVAFGTVQGDVKFLTPEPDGQVLVTLNVVEMRVGKIVFEWKGRRRTAERVFRATMRTRSGHFFNTNVLSDDLREIQRLDVLDDLRVKETRVAADDPSKLDLVFEVVEKRTGNVAGGGGISSRYGLVGFVDIGENNLWGLTHRTSARVEFGGRFNFSTNYYYPLLDGQGTDLNLRLYNTEDRTGATGIGAFTNSRTNFDQLRRGFSIGFSRPIIPTVRSSVVYEYETVKTQRRGSNLPNLPPFPFQDLGRDTTSSVTLGVSHDTRDTPYDATEGMYQSGTAQLAGVGGNNTFTKIRLETRHYWPVLGGRVKVGKTTRPAWVVATRGQFGFSDGKLPFSQSFFVGGSETLRGYTEDRFFGDRMFLFNLELRRAFPYNIQGVVFFDAGRAWIRGEKIGGFSDLASAVGVGLRVNTPVGPIRFDLGFGARGSRTHFSFGQPF